MEYRVNTTHKVTDLDCFQQIIIRYILDNGLCLDGVANVRKFTSWVSDELSREKDREVSAYVCGDSRLCLDEDDKRFYSEKEFIKKTLIRDLSPFNYNIHTDEGIKDLVQELENRCLLFSEEMNVVKIDEIVKDYRIFYHLDLDDEQSAKHFTTWFVECVDDLVKFQSEMQSGSFDR
jgi:hypothetical protein